MRNPQFSKGFERDRKRPGLKKYIGEEPVNSGIEHFL
jgi:hypothetical protein